MKDHAKSVATAAKRIESMRRVGNQAATIILQKMQLKESRDRLNALKQLKAFLAERPSSATLDTYQVASLLAACWNCLNGGNATKMRAEKLWRIEEATWNPPFLEFLIERHGQTVNGSTRATVYRWRVDVERATADIIGEKRRQLYSMDERLNVKPIAESLADAIVHAKEDARLAVGKDGTVRLKIGEIIPATNQQTRRSRLRKQLAVILAPHGWKELKANVYRQVE